MGIFGGWEGFFVKRQKNKKGSRGLRPLKGVPCFSVDFVFCVVYGGEVILYNRRYGWVQGRWVILLYVCGVSALSVGISGGADSWWGTFFQGIGDEQQV